MTHFSKIKYVALTLTMNCNLKCKYCYLGEKSNEKLNIDIAKQALDFISTHSVEDLRITFFGGEPLIEFDLIKEIVDYSKKKYPKFEFFLCTNGTLFNDSILEYLHNNNIEITLSLDGNQIQHDHSRYYSDGKGSYDNISRYFTVLIEKFPTIYIDSVIEPDAINYLYDGVVSLYNNGFRFLSQSLNFSAKWVKSDIKALKKQYKKIADFCLEKFYDNTVLFYYQFDDRIRTLFHKDYLKGQCDLGNTELVISASGKLFPCVQFISHHINDDYCIGNIFDGFDDEKRQRIIKTNLLPKEECIGCALDGRCFNFCGCENFRATGSISKISPLLCEHERMIFPIVDKLAEKLWKKNSTLFNHRFKENG